MSITLIKIPEDSAEEQAKTERLERLINDGLRIAFRLAVDEGVSPGEACERGWHEVGLDPSNDIPFSVRKLIGQGFPTTVYNAIEERAEASRRAARDAT